MFEKVNPYLKEELNEQAAAHLCGCRCRANTGTMSIAIGYAVSFNGCYASCQGETNSSYNYDEALSDKSWSK